VPNRIRREFELKDCHRDCADCHLDKDFKNSGGDNNLSSSNGNSKDKEKNPKPGEKKLPNKHSTNQQSKSSFVDNGGGWIIGVIALTLFTMGGIIL